MPGNACGSSAHVPSDMLTSEWRLIVSGNASPPRRLMEEALADLLERRGESGLVTIELVHPVAPELAPGSEEDQIWRERVEQIGVPGPEMPPSKEYEVVDPPESFEEAARDHAETHMRSRYG